MTRELTHRELDDSLFYADYFHLVEYFRLNAALLRCIGYVCLIDCIHRPTCFLDNFAASD